MAVGTAALQRFADLVAANDPDPVGSVVKRVQADPTVAGVRQFDPSSIVIVFKNGIGLGVAFAEMTSDGWQTRAALASVELCGSPAAIVCDPKNYPSSKTACIVRAFSEEMSQDIKTVTDPLSRAGFTIRNYGLTSVDDVLKFHDGLRDCGVIYVRTHGVMNEDFAYEFSNAKVVAGCDPSNPTKNHCGNHLLTQIALIKDNLFPTLQALKAKLGRIGSIIGTSPHTSKKDGTIQTYLTLAPEFFADVTYKNALVYMDACHSDETIPTPPGGDQLRDAFTLNGAGAFLGWSKAVPEFLASRAAAGIVDKLAPKPVNVDSITLSAPGSQAAGQSYAPTATVAPAQAGVEISLGVSRTDGNHYSQTKTTDASGHVTFDPIPGGAAGTVDTVTASAGGASDSNTVATVVKNDPTLQLDYSLFSDDVNIANLNENSVKDFNLACVNAKLTSKNTKVTFIGGGGGGSLPCGSGSPYVNCPPPTNPTIRACMPGEYECADTENCYATEQEALNNCAPIWCVRCH
ncbi:MAG TPA: hypothetical protein VFH73_05530 [Polyangia bacterium]|nr:hypothetical protein [Polyangia bacterium]